MSSSTISDTLSNDFATPIAQRVQQRGLLARLRAATCYVALLVSFLQINGLQFLFLPLALLPPTRPLYHMGIRYTKAAFGIVLVFMCQAFAPTKFRVTYEISGSYSEEWLEVDPKSGSLMLKLPKKLAVISNHQIYADWWYLWVLSYMANTHAYILIVLKRSLKWLPVLGWGMQFFDFIFVRAGPSTMKTLTSHLSRLAAHHVTTTADRPEDDEPLNFLLFPEGTLVSRDTYPKSTKYAEKMNLPHPEHLLLPRSTGLHTTLLALSQLPSLYLMDVTMLYPGIPVTKFGQDYYTLRSIFIDGVSPPEVVYHIRLYNVQKEVPIRANGTDTNTGLTMEQRKHLAHSMSKDPTMLEIGEEDKVVFDTWLRERWREKDQMIDSWLKRGGKGPIATGDNIKEVVLPVKLRSIWELVGPFLAFAPIAVAYYSLSNRSS